MYDIVTAHKLGSTKFFLWIFIITWFDRSSPVLLATSTSFPHHRQPLCHLHLSTPLAGQDFTSGLLFILFANLFNCVRLSRIGFRFSAICLWFDFWTVCVDLFVWLNCICCSVWLEDWLMGDLFQLSVRCSKKVLCERKIWVHVN